MNTGTTLEILSTSSAHTESVGEAIGKRLKGGEVIELTSDVGGGKTTFVRGLARGAGSSDLVASPTFTISKQYKTPKFTINHLDLYRLGDDPGLIKQELAEIVRDVHEVVVAEWADSVSDVLPAQRLTMAIQYRGNTERKLVLVVPHELTYLLQELNQ